MRLLASGAGEQGPACPMHDGELPDSQKVPDERQQDSPLHQIVHIADSLYPDEIGIDSAKEFE